MVFGYSHVVHPTRDGGGCPRLRNLSVQNARKRLRNLSVQDARKKLGKFHKGEELRRSTAFARFIRYRPSGLVTCRTSMPNSLPIRLTPKLHVVRLATLQSSTVGGASST